MCARCHRVYLSLAQWFSCHQSAHPNALSSMLVYRNAQVHRCNQCVSTEWWAICLTCGYRRGLRIMYWLRDSIKWHDIVNWRAVEPQSPFHFPYIKRLSLTCNPTDRPRQPFHIKQTITNKPNSACASHLVLVKTPTEMGHEIIRPKPNRKQKSSNARRRRSHGKHLGQLHNGHFSPNVTLL